MKKSMILSLTFALAGAFTGLIHDAKTTNTPLSMTYDTQISQDANTFDNAQNEGDRLSREDYTTEKNDGANKTNNSTKSNSTTPNSSNRNLNGVTNKNLTNNTLYQDNQGSSPYGINNANRGVLPNNTTQNSTSNNVNSMVRTNNIDTYKNNSVTNIDGRVYDSNGVLIMDNSQENINTNRVNDPTFNPTNTKSSSNVSNARSFETDTKNNTTANNSSTNLTNSNTTQNSATQNSTNTTQNANKISLSNTDLNANDSSSTTNTDSITNSNTNTSLNTTPRQDISLTRQTQDTKTTDDISTINNELSNLTATMNEKMEEARSNISRVLDQSIQLDDAKITMLNAYSHVIHCLDMKLAQNHFELMRTAGHLAVMKTEQGEEANVEPINLEMRCILNVREVCLNCMIEALDELNSVFDGLNTQTEVRSTKLNSNSVVSTSAIPQTKEYRTFGPNKTAHSAPRA